jgi:hypothetical protein
METRRNKPQVVPIRTQAPPRKERQPNQPPDILKSLAEYLQRRSALRARKNSGPQANSNGSLT